MQARGMLRLESGGSQFSVSGNRGTSLAGDRRTGLEDLVTLRIFETARTY